MNYQLIRAFLICIFIFAASAGVKKCDDDVVLGPERPITTTTSSTTQSPSTTSTTSSTTSSTSTTSIFPPLAPLSSQ